MPVITLDCSEAIFASYSDIVLRAAIGKTSTGEDISPGIKVTPIYTHVTSIVRTTISWGI